MATITLHPVGDCRWSKQDADSRWACVVDGHQRFVDEHECTTCLFWERAAERSILVASAPSVALQVSVRAVLVLAALLFAAIGASILTRPLMVPVTIALWLGAAGLVGLAAFARLSAD
jgi:hypothetical protein